MYFFYKFYTFERFDFKEGICCFEEGKFEVDRVKDFLKNEYGIESDILNFEPISREKFDHFKFKFVLSNSLIYGPVIEKNSCI